jgi:hypothetical protein
LDGPLQAAALIGARLHGSQRQAAFRSNPDRCFFVTGKRFIDNGRIGVILGLAKPNRHKLKQHIVI